eukprot:357568-Chlamydomonas_euryale.AAC.5
MEQGTGRGVPHVRACAIGSVGLRTIYAGADQPFRLAAVPTCNANRVFMPSHPTQTVLAMALHGPELA